MNLTLQANGTLAATAARAGTFRAAFGAFLRTHVVEPAKARRVKSKTLDQIAAMSERDLADLGYSRDELRRSVLTGTNLRD